MSKPARIVQDTEDIEAVLKWAAIQQATANADKTAPYARGIVAMWRWLIGQTKERPDA